MSKLTIQNYTEWNTSAIREAVRAAEKFFDLKWDRKVIVKTARRHGMRGRAAYPVDRRTLGRLKRGYKGKCEGQWVKLYLPPKPPEDHEQFERSFMWLVLHEVAHNAGMSHRDMGVASALNKVWGQTEKPAAMRELGIHWDGSVRNIVDHSKLLIAQSRLLITRSQKVTADRERWEALLKQREAAVKRAKKRLAKLRERERYYERRLAGQPEPQSNVVPLRAEEPAPAPQLIAAKEDPS